MIACLLPWIIIQVLTLLTSCSFSSILLSKLIFNFVRMFCISDNFSCALANVNCLSLSEAKAESADSFLGATILIKQSVI